MSFTDRTSKDNMSQDDEGTPLESRRQQRENRSRPWCEPVVLKSGGRYT